MLDNIKQHPTWVQWKKDHPNGNALIILVGLVFIWRGIWSFLDAYLFPSYPLLSYLVSISVGAAILYLDDFNLSNLRR